jgi:hypothetical protein
MAVSRPIEMAGIELAVVAAIATARVETESIIESSRCKPQRVTVAGDGARVSSTGDAHLHPVRSESGFFDGELVAASYPSTKPRLRHSHPTTRFVRTTPYVDED